jgi:hypothetical protein
VKMIRDDTVEKALTKKARGIEIRDGHQLESEYFILAKPLAVCGMLCSSGLDRIRIAAKRHRPPT